MQKHPKEKLIAGVLVLAPEKGSFPHLLKTAVQIAGMFKVQVRLLETLSFASERPQKEKFYRDYLEAQSDQSGVAWDAVIFGDSLQKALKEFSCGELLVLLKGDDSFDLSGVLREVSGPALIVPQTFNRDFKEILLAHVGGRFSDRALGMAAMLNKHGRAHVRVLAIGTGPSLSLRAAHSQAQYLFERWKVKVDYKIMHGDIKKTLLSECDAGNADLLMLGASELEDWKDHRFRLFSQAMVEEADCPVMVVK